MTCFLSRAAADDDPFRVSLAASGIDVVACDLIATEIALDRDRVPEVMARCRDSEYVVLTSARGVRAIVELTGGDTSWAGEMKGRLLCAGEKTSAEAEQSGLAPVETLTPGGQQSVIGYLERMGLQAGETVTLLRSEAADDRLPKFIGSRGATVADIALYRPAVNRSERTLRTVAAVTRNPPDAFAFTSPSTVDAFLELAGLPDVVAYFRNSIRIAIGPTTARALIERTGGVDYSSETHRLEDMARIVSETLTRRQPHGSENDRKRREASRNSESKGRP